MRERPGRGLGRLRRGVGSRCLACCGYGGRAGSRNAIVAAGGSLCAMSIRPRCRARRRLDAAIAEGLLAGRSTPAEAPAAQQALARLLEVAAAPGSEQELAGEVAAAAMFVQVTSRARSRRTIRRVAAAVACAVALGGAGVYASAMPPPSHRTEHVRFGVPALRHTLPAPDVSVVPSRPPGAHTPGPAGQATHPGGYPGIPLRLGSR